VESKSKKLRSGYTTGACAAAAAKAAALLLLRTGVKVQSIEIPFPDDSRVTFKVHDSGLRTAEKAAFASIIKDAGDDPDVTHLAEIRAEVSACSECAGITITGGKGVGRVTKPGLAIPVGEAAINPVPLKMIERAVREAVNESRTEGEHLLVTISVPAGEELAKKTLNNRLGIVGGISILGTTGIVRPVSIEAYTASITAGMDVAKAMGHSVVVLSSGRTSEKAHIKRYGLPDEAYVMMGDYLEFSLQDAKKHGFGTIHLCAQWAKMIKTAMSTPQTHVRHGAIEGNDAAVFLRSRGIAIPDRQFNTAREIFDHISSDRATRDAVLATVCKAAKQYAETIASGVPIIVSLVSYEGEIIADSE
jgi:cobalt-precorrin-5B (C1)-methyltransferase